jgi:hypothetical protein
MTGLFREVVMGYIEDPGDPLYRWVTKNLRFWENSYIFRAHSFFMSNLSTEGRVRGRGISGFWGIGGRSLIPEPIKWIYLILSPRYGNK